MGSEKFLLCIIIVVLLITIFNTSNMGQSLREKMFAANYTGAPGAKSVKPVVDQQENWINMRQWIPSWLGGEGFKQRWIK